MRSSGYREKIRNHIFLQEMIWRMFHLEQSRRLSCPLYLPRRTLERLYTMSALLPKADIRRRELDVRFVLKADRCTAFPGTVIASCHARKIHNVWHSTSVQPFYLCGDSGRVDMSNCGWNCQLAVSDNQPVPHPLAVILGRVVGSDAPSRRASGTHNSICFSSSDERRITPQFPGLRQRKQCPLWVISGHWAMSSRCLLYPQKRTSIRGVDRRPKSSVCKQSGLIISRPPQPKGGPNGIP